MELLDALKQHKIIAIARKLPKEKIVQTAEALYAGGIRFVEVTFDQSSPRCIEDTTEAISALCRHFQGKMYIGAGTVTNVAQAEAAVSAGAQYLISPSFSEAVVKRTVELGAVSIPGALTPTEVTAAFEAGAHIVKLFPAGELGLGYIKAVLAPLSHIPMVAVGGIDENNIVQFLKAGLQGVGIGSNIVKNELIAQDRFDELTALAKKYTQIIL